MTDLTLRLARRMGIDDNALTNIRRGVLLHDIGKMGIPDQILNKHGDLSESEQQEMQKHPQYAYDLIYPILYLRPAIEIPYCHHERWDGSGYPRGIKGEQIPLAARIFAVVDVWDTLLHDQPLSAVTQAEAAAYLKENSGTLFDPQVVTAFLETSGIVFTAWIGLTIFYASVFSKALLDPWKCQTLSAG